MDGPPQSWPPYATTKDCSLGYCSIYCPQWCYFLFPTPPPTSSSSSGPALSPLLISVIAILSTAFLLIAYYTILSKYRQRLQSLLAGRPPPAASSSDDLAAWRPTSQATGLDESLINKITTCQYPTDNVVTTVDCSVCLAEFEHGETLRLLPSCGHAFHLGCIDIWLKSHCTCPLCRASIVVPDDSPSSIDDQTTDQVAVAVEEIELVIVGSTGGSGEVDEEEGCSVKSDVGGSGVRVIGRSFSMDSTLSRRISISDHLGFSRLGRALHGGISPVRMKRSFSSGRLMRFTSNGRGSTSAVLPSYMT